MYKKFVIIFIIFINIFTFNCIADDKIEELEFKEVEKVIKTATNIAEVPKINSRYAVIIDRSNNTILYGKKENEKTKMASTTKIMTALIVMENANLNDVVEISKKAANTGGSRLKINTGDKITVKDLLYGLMLRSGNDAAVALAEYVGGSIEGFAAIMNNKAEELGLKNTHFVTPHGLDADEHYTTAYELAVLSNYALNNKTFYKIVNTKTCSISVNGILRQISNTNELLGYLNGVYGVKTGFTNGAGRCLVTATKRGNMDYICVVLGADTKKYRTEDSIKLIEYTFNNFERYNINKKIEEEFNNWININKNRIVINKAISNNICLKLDNYNIKEYVIAKGTQEQVNIEIENKMNFEAPVLQGIIIAKVKVMYKDKIIEEINIVVNEEIQRKNVLDYILEFMRNLPCYFKYKVNS